MLYNDLKSGGYLHPVYNMVSIYNHEGQTNYNCDNYWLFTAIAAQLCAYDCWPGSGNYYAVCLVNVGLIRRHPGADDTSQQELAGCASLNPLGAQDIESYGRKNDYCYNVSNPGKFSWQFFFARFIDFEPFICMMAGKRIWFGQILWSIGLITTALSAYGNTSEKCYKWLQVERVAGKYFLTNRAIYIWRKLMQKKYPRGPQELFEIYFPAKHPLIQYAPNVF